MLRKGNCQRRRQGHEGGGILADGYEELKVWPCAPQDAQEEAARCGRDRGGGRRGRRVCDKAEGVAVELVRALIEVLAVCGQGNTRGAPGKLPGTRVELRARACVCLSETVCARAGSRMCACIRPRMSVIDKLNPKP